MQLNVEQATRDASKRWQDFFNSGNAAGCASCYENDALMSAQPFGEFTGRETIQNFWQNLMNEGFAEVEYINAKITVVDENSALLTSDWRMNKAHGIITKELWVRQQDGSMALREDYFEVAE